MSALTNCLLIEAKAIACTAEKLDNKQALHAERLGFEHPLSKENHIFQSDPPKEMLDIINLI